MVPMQETYCTSQYNRPNCPVRLPQSHTGLQVAPLGIIARVAKSTLLRRKVKGPDNVNKKAGEGCQTLLTD